MGGSEAARTAEFGAAPSPVPTPGALLSELGLVHESLPGSAVDGEVAQGVVLVIVGGLAVDPEGFEPGMPGDLRDDDEILAAADELVDERVPADVGGGL